MAALAAALGLLWAGGLSAGEITCIPDNQRVATLSDAVECKTLNSVNLNSPAQIDALFDDLGDPWVKEGELTGAGTNDLLTVTADSWGVDVEGQWFIDNSFWSMYSRAVVTMHVGQGGGNPDAFAWLITPGETSGSSPTNEFPVRAAGCPTCFCSGRAIRAGTRTRHARAARPGPSRSRPDEAQGELTSKLMPQRARPRARLFVCARTGQIFPSPTLARGAAAGELVIVLMPVNPQVR